MQNIYSKISRFFVTNREFSWITLVTLFILGIFAFINTPKQYNPEISLPAFRITTEWPGATVEEVEQLITNEVENKLSEIPGVDETFSESFAGGRSIVTVMFEIGNELEASKTKVTEKMASNMDMAPLGVNPPLIQQVNPENVPIMTLAISGKDYSAEGLREFAYDLREKLKTVPGVTNLEINGGRARQLNVLLDPERVAARQVSVREIISAIKANNLRVPAGYLEGENKYIPVELDGNLTSRDQLARIAITGSESSTVYLEDIATIEDGYELTEKFVRYRRDATVSRFDNAVYLSLAKRKGENGVTVSQAVRDQLANLEDTFIPEDINIDIVRDEGRTAAEAISGLSTNLVIAIIIVTLLLVFFLRARAAFVVAIAIPLTLAMVLFVGYLVGETINRITLFALILSLGLLVDSATVVVENIYRHIAKKTESHTEAVVGAVGEVGTGLLMSTITSVIVFIPMSFVTGMMGAYMGPIAFFVPVALIASLIVAYTLSPFLAAKIFKQHEGEASKEQKTRKVDVWYRKKITAILDSRKKQNWVLGIVLTAVLVSFTFPVFEIIHFRMLPKADKEQFFVYLDAPEGTSLAQANELATLAEDFLLQDSEVTSVQSFIGTNSVVDFNGLFKGSDQRKLPHQATLKVNLTHPSERSEDSESIVVRLRPELKQLFAAEPDLRLTLVEDPPGPPVLATLLARVKGPNQETREEIARDLVKMYQQTEGVVDINTTLTTGVPEKRLTIDHAKVAHSGLSVAEVIQTLSTALSGKSAGIAHLATREQNQILVRFAKSDRDEVSDLSRVFLKNRAGEMVALSSLAKVVDTTSPAAIWHDEREAVTFVSAELSERAVVYAVKDLIFKLKEYQLPNKNGELIDWSLFGFEFQEKNSREKYTVEWDGEFEMTLENFRDLGLAMGVAFFLVYVVLVTQFRSFRTPMLVMSSIILAFGGVMPGFAILDWFGVYFTATSMIGLIALGGIVVNNAIILLEFLQQLKERGLPAKAAIIEACQTRLRPIVLTSLTTILGSLTIAGDPVWSGLAWSIVFGLSLSTVLTLLVFPVLYYRFEGRE